MLAPSKHKYSKTLAFPDTYYELIINLLQSVELFCTYVKTQFKICQKPPKKSKRQTMRQSLKSTPPIIGDVASCIRPEDYLTMA